ncbi:DUF6758 family protein [Nocardioides panaciterrulae]|uniref:Uncharacterized protein n=1 Tax=Nocardioides panaciterrulae TaxID=661492 RepID=A0A7Y9J9T9_9ACTN|nr:DUF6758 family protein [Nocardioides panaciterrulae]NYD40987.1 hypothetical protein [Nocardioides panaciterrulae]
MSLEVGCPRCSTPVARSGSAGWSCPEHGPIEPMRRPREASYDAFAEHLLAADGFPTYLPWPLSPGWSVSDFAVVGEDGRVTATLTCAAGPSELDGPVDVVVVAEETGTGLGARLAGIDHDDPGPEVGQGSPSVRIRIESQVVPLWLVSISAGDGEQDRSVLAGEAQGRWLWLVLRPASAILMLREDWILRDVSRIGAPLLETPFGGAAPLW